MPLSFPLSDAWGVPPSTKPDVYVRWAKSVPVKLGDALFFLYPPSQDSAVQLTAKAFAACDVSDPLLKLEDGNSVFNLTKPGRAYFSSVGEEGWGRSSPRLHALDLV